MPTLTSISIPLWFGWKSVAIVCISMTLAYFNSTLVRLKAGKFPPVNSIRQISIPLWFGWKIRLVDCQKLTRSQFQFHFGSVESHWGRKGRAVAAEFQFHFGSVERIIKKPNKKAQADFNSTLVRLKGYLYLSSDIPLRISIPLWFGWKAIHDASKEVKKLFQFHFGSVESATFPFHRFGFFIFQFHFGSVERIIFKNVRGQI